MFGIREGGKPYKTQAVVFLSSRNASQFVGEEHCVTRRKRLQGRLEVGFIKVRSTLQVKRLKTDIKAAELSVCITGVSDTVRLQGTSEVSVRIT